MISNIAWQTKACLPPRTASFDCGSAAPLRETRARGGERRGLLHQGAPERSLGALERALVETGWSLEEGHPYYSMAIIILLSDIKHLINNSYSWGALPMVT